MRRCSADVFVSSAAARGGGTGTGTAALKDVLSCGSIAAQAEKRSATTPATASRAPGPELFFVRLEPAMLAESPIGDRPISGPGSRARPRLALARPPPPRPGPRSRFAVRSGYREALARGRFDRSSPPELHKPPRMFCCCVARL